MKILAFIPARSGSKRIPNKNIKLLNGKPLIAYTIEAAKNSKFINRIIVSTDSEQIAEIAKKYGAEVPFLRPANISNADSTEMEFFEHALNWFSANENYEPDLNVLLYPTSPFRKTESIDRAISEMLKHPQADSLRSIRLCSEHPYKMWIIKDDLLKSFVKAEIPDMHTFSYHLLPKVYIQNASIYITRPSTIKDKKSPTGDIIIPFIMDEMESQDINAEIDFYVAEQYINKINGIK
jgi:CMP-N-acetylneuraminic acid synthetase